MAGEGSVVARLRFEFLGDLKHYRESLKVAKAEGDAASKTMGQSFKAAFGTNLAAALKSAVAPKTIAAPLAFPSQKEWVRDQLQAWTALNSSATMPQWLAKARSLRTEYKGLADAAAAHTVALSGTQRAMTTAGNVAGVLGGRVRTIASAFGAVPMSTARAFATAGLNAFHSGLNKITNTAKGFISTLKSIPANIFKGIGLGIGLGMFQSLEMEIAKLIHAIPDLITRGKEYGQMVADVMHATGATGEESSKLAATLTYINKGPINNLTQLLAQFQRNLIGTATTATNAGAALRRVFGYDIDQLSTMNAVEMLDKLRSGFSKIVDMPTKAGLEQKLFGRGGFKYFHDYLRMTDEDWTRLVADLQSQGLIISSEQAMLAENTQRELNRMSNAWAGLANKLFNEVAPTIMAFITKVSDWLTAHSGEIAKAVGTVVESIMGLVAGLTGTGDTLVSFTSGMEKGTSKVTQAESAYFAADNALREYDDSTKAATASTAGSTKAIDAQIKALEALDKAQERIYTKALQRLNDQLDAQLKLLDAAEAARNLAEQQHDLNEQLNEAMIDLQKAQAGEFKDGKLTVNADDVAAAMKKIADTRQQQGELEHDQMVARQRADIQSTKDYLAEIEKLVSDAATSKVAYKEDYAELEKRRKALTAGGQPAAGSAAATELEAVLAAEKRVRQQGVNDATQARLQAQRDEIAGAKTVTDAKRAELVRQLKDAKANYDKETAAEAHALAIRRVHHRDFYKGVGVDAEGTFGEKGTASQAFLDWEKVGLAAIASVKAAFEGIGKVIGETVDLLGTLGDLIGGIDKNQLAIGLMALGVATGHVEMVLAGMAMTAAAIATAQPQPVTPNTPGSARPRTSAQGGTGQAPQLQQALATRLGRLPTMDEMSDAFKAAGIPVSTQMVIFDQWKGKGLVKGWAAGGLAGVHGPESGRLGERGPEWVINAPALRALSSLNRAPMQTIAAAAGGGVGPIEFHSHLYLDGRQVAEVVDRWQADKRRF